MMKNCVLIGPSDYMKICKFGRIKKIRHYIKDAAHFLSDLFDEIIIIPDEGLALLIAQEYKKFNPIKKVIGYVPGNTSGGKNLERYHQYCDELKRNSGGWFNLNTELTRKSEFVFCLGFSAGVFIELCSIKYNQTYLNLNTKIFIDRRCISSPLPKEVAFDLKNLNYFSDFNSLKNLINYE